jgi:hypothetical protein
MHLNPDSVGNVIFKKDIVRTSIFAVGDDNGILLWQKKIYVGNDVNQTVVFVLCDYVLHEPRAVRFQNQVVT